MMKDSKGIFLVIFQECLAMLSSPVMMHRQGSVWARTAFQNLFFGKTKFIFPFFVPKLLECHFTFTNFQYRKQSFDKFETETDIQELNGIDIGHLTLWQNMH